jgi:hypothetical protein
MGTGKPGITYTMNILLWVLQVLAQSVSFPPAIAPNSIAAIAKFKSRHGIPPMSPTSRTRF